MTAHHYDSIVHAIYDRCDAWLAKRKKTPPRIGELIAYAALVTSAGKFRWDHNKELVYLFAVNPYTFKRGKITSYDIRFGGGEGKKAMQLDHVITVEVDEHDLVTSLRVES